MNINISTNISSVTKALNAFGKNQIPFAASRALNDVAFHMSRKVMPKKSNDTFAGGATAFTKRGFKYKKSNKRNLTAEVFIDTAQEKYLKFQISGGNRFPEKRSIIVPTSNTKLNRYGNITRATYSRIINDKKKFFKGIPRGRTGKSNEGIWERYGNNKNIRIVARYVDKAQYEPLFPFGKIGERVVFSRNQGFADRFRVRLQEAKRTARR